MLHKTYDLTALKSDPIGPLLRSGNSAVVYAARRDLLGEAVGAPAVVLWDLPTPQRIVRTQQADGSWRYPGQRAGRSVNYDLLETYRQLGYLIEMFRLDRTHPAIARAASYVFIHQSDEGDLRGIYGHQYSPNYTAGFIELLLKAGYADATEVHRAFAWLERMQQQGGGWALPLRTRGRNLDAVNDRETIQPDDSQPLSHLITGIVLRAYAAHPRLRESSTAQHAADLLVSRFFAPDAYADRRSPEHWTRFSYPFWWTDILSALDSTSQINPKLGGDNIRRACGWFISHQLRGGLFGGHLLRDRFRDLRLWYSLAVCRVLTRLLEKSDRP